MLALLTTALSFSTSGAPLRLRPSPRGSAVCSAAMDRRAALAAAATALAAVPPAFAAPAASDGKWARHEGEFEDAEFDGFKKTDSGLEYKIVQEGYGVKPKAGQGIKAHYSGYLLNGAKFDSSYDRRKPLGFDVGTGRVIKGWDEALLDMKVGELRVLKIPSNLGYGAKGAGGIIPPGVRRTARTHPTSPIFAFLARTTSRPTITAVWPSLLRVQATLVFYVELVALTS